jgi:paraquat-inducible protein A
MNPEAPLTCHLCGLEHAPLRLDPGAKALCARCSTVMAQGRRPGPDAAFIFSATGLVLAIPAALLPFVSAGNLGDERVSFLFTGVARLWVGGMRPLAVLVLVCGGLLPLALLAILAILRAPTRPSWGTAAFGPLTRAAHGLGHWAIPEVQVLAVLVGLVKLRSSVSVTIGPGFWCYAAMAFFLLIADHSFEFNPPPAP